MQEVIKINNVTWNILDRKCFIIARYGLTARLIFKTATAGIMLTRNAVNGCMRKQKFTAA